MNCLLVTYTSRFIWRRKLFGYLFCGRYKSLLVDGSNCVCPAKRTPASTTMQKPA